MSISQNEIISSLNWRYATKQFDATKNIDEQTWNTILEALRLSPSSYGLELWKFVVVENPEIREHIKAAAWNQPQVTDADKLIVLAAKTSVSEEDIESFISRTALTRGMDRENLAGYEGMIKGDLLNRTEESITSWTHKQVGIATGFLLETAALLGVDACPMEGFAPDKVTDILGLGGEGFVASVMVALGYRLDEDKMAHAKKVRLPHEDVFKYAK